MNPRSIKHRTRRPAPDPTSLLLVLILLTAKIGAFTLTPAAKHPCFSNLPQQYVVTPLDSRFSRRIPLSLATKSDSFPSDSRKKRLAATMAFLTGWADVSVLRRYATFPTMMSGNTIWMASAAVNTQIQLVGYYASVIISYLLGLVVVRRMDLSSVRRNRCLRRCASLVLLLFAGSDLLHRITQTRWIPVMMLAVGYGIINSVGTAVTGTLTFVVTGHLTRLTHQAVDCLSRTNGGRQKLTESDREAICLNVGVVLAFFAGGFLAAFLHARQWLTKSAFSIMGAIYYVLFSCIDMESIGGAWLPRLRLGRHWSG